MTRTQTGRHDAAYNAVAVASIAYQQQINALRHILTTAKVHGLTDLELVEASGLPHAFITKLLEDA